MLKLILLSCTLTCIQCDITNLNEFLSTVKQNPSIEYPIGFLSRANYDVVKRYLLGNMKEKFFAGKGVMLKAIDNGTITAGVTTGRLAADLEPRYHVFSSLRISPQAMLVAPDYDPKLFPYGLQNKSSSDLFDALNAAIVGIQAEGSDETLLTRNNRTDIARVYTCQQNSPLPVVNGANATGYLKDILYTTKTLRIGGLGPFDWGTQEGNYKAPSPTGFYPELLEAIVKKLGKLRGPNGNIYGDDLTFNRTYYPDAVSLFQALLNGSIDATDVYLLIDAPYTGTDESCSNDTQCRARESCTNSTCTHPERPRSLHFRTTCTTASRDTKFITKKNTPNGMAITSADTPRQTPKTRWIAILLLSVVIFGTVFLALLIIIRRKKNYRVEHTLQGGFGKFARLQEESELPIEAMDSFDDHIVQSPTENTNSTT